MKSCYFLTSFFLPIRIRQKVRI